MAAVSDGRGLRNYARRRRCGATATLRWRLGGIAAAAREFGWPNKGEYQRAWARRHISDSQTARRTEACFAPVQDYSRRHTRA
eukprot:934976-Pleurochrysis_carterae.AAC.1